MKTWFNSLPKNIIATWDEMANKFLTKYFPPSKAAKLRGDLTTFSQLESKSIFESWKRYKGMIRKVPHHRLPDQRGNVHKNVYFVKLVKVLWCFGFLDTSVIAYRLYGSNP